MATHVRRHSDPDIKQINQPSTINHKTRNSLHHLSQILVNEKKKYEINKLKRMRSRSQTPRYQDIYPNISNSSDRILPVAENKKVKSDFDAYEAWCSWCYHKTYHGKIQQNYFRRNVYTCFRCSHRTLVCRHCGNMSRGHGTWDDELCIVCDGTIDEWGKNVINVASIHGYCSWCLYLTTHQLHMTNLLRRNSYICQSCNSRTAICILCQSAFTRCSQINSELLCLLCSGNIDDWKQVYHNISKLSKDFKIKHHYLPSHSFSLVRSNQYAYPIIDGEEYYDALHYAFLHAKESIYISYWHMNHMIYLKRSYNSEPNIEDRIDKMLLRAAERGIKIYVLLWKENLRIAMDNFSYDMKRILVNLHSNIKVIRHTHPNISELWCHHQKFVVIDQDLSIVGGFDCCLGRYDTPQHILTDPDEILWKGVDYYNPHLLRPNPEQILDFFQDIINRQKVPRMPWHDVAFEVLGWAARDAAANFVERWNHHNELLGKGFEKLAVKDNKDFNLDLSLSRFNSLKKQTKIKRCKTAPNAKIKSFIETLNDIDFDSKHSPIQTPLLYASLQDLMKRTVIQPIDRDKSTTPTNENKNITNPSNDASSLFFGGTTTLSNRIDRPISPPLPPSLIKSPSDSIIPTSPTSELITEQDIHLDRNFIHHQDPPLGTCHVQMIRSLDKWSGGWRNEQSIRFAYEKAIEESQHYIYIENQYLSSDLAGGGVVNHCFSLLLKKLIDKISNHEKFRVIILLPQPEEQGQFAMNILKWQYRTINRGGTSLLEQLVNHFPNEKIEDYISFYFLRNYGFLNGVPVTEKVFIHSKVLIVDDRIAIVSSANFNDRSFLGDRDSELGMIVQDDQLVDILMDGKPYKSGKFCYDLRMRLWSEHLGFDYEMNDLIEDPICDETYNNIWMRIAQNNTNIYENVFPTIPRNIYTTWKEYEDSGGFTVPAKAVNDGELLHNIQGHLTMHPIGFLINDNVDYTILAFVSGDIIFQ